MKNFRSYIWNKLCENIENLDFTAEILHLLNDNEVKNILNKFDFSGRKNITLGNLKQFKDILIFYVRKHSPKLVASILKENNPKSFHPLINQWKSMMSIMGYNPKPVKYDDEEFSLANPIEEPQIEIKPKKSLIDENGIMKMFPPVGSNTYERLYWALQQEKLEKETLSNKIVRYFYSILHYKPIGVKDKLWSLMQKEFTNEYSEYYSKKLFCDIAKYDIIGLHDTINDLLKYLVKMKIIRIKGNELEWLASQWCNAEYPKKLSLEMIKKIPFDEKYHLDENSL